MKPKLIKSEIKCLFGFHEYTIPWKENRNVLICENCKRVGYYKNSNGIETWYDYDEKGNIIHCKYSDGYEVWYDYDEEGNEIRYRDSYGLGEWWDYNKEGNRIRYRNSYGHEEWYDYDEEGNMVHCKYSNGNEVWYDENKWVSKKPKNWRYEKCLVK